MDVVVAEASHLLPGLWESILWKLVFALAGNEVAEITSQE